MFMLKDVLVKTAAQESIFETKDVTLQKYDALAKMRAQSSSLVFLQAMRLLLQSRDFKSISESFVQLELLDIVAGSPHFALIEPLMLLLSKSQREKNLKLESVVEEAVSESIERLQLTKRVSQTTQRQATQAQSQKLNNIGKIKSVIARNIQQNQQFKF